MSGVLRRLLIVGLLGVALVGCTDGGTSDARPVRTLPPRPTAAPADRIVPCSMLTLAQQQELSLRYQTPGVGHVDNVPSPSCTWIGTRVFSINIQYIPLGTEQALDDPAAVLTDVNGFGAVQNVPNDVSDGAPFCQVTVDTGPGQSIRVQALTSADKNVPVSETCRQANHVASLAMTTILATAGH